MKLTNYDEGRRRIQLAHSVDELADIRNKARALTEYARRAKDNELLAWVSEIKVRAERRVGELIPEQQKNGKLAKQGGDRKSGSRSQAATLKATDITKSDSSRWQRIAKMADDEFEAAIADAKDRVGEVTTTFVLERAPKPKSQRRKPKPKKLMKDRDDSDGQNARFYTVVQGCQAIVELKMTPHEWLEDSPPDVRYVVKPRVLPAVQWLSKLLEILR